MKAKVMIRAIALAVVALVLGWLVASVALAAGGVVIRKPIPSVREVGPRHDFLRIWQPFPGELPLGCEWVDPKAPIAELAVDCSGASPLTFVELVCSQGTRARRSYERQYGIDCPD